jgi:hypothetical protein
MQNPSLPKKKISDEQKPAFKFRERQGQSYFKNKSGPLFSLKKGGGYA